MKEWERAVLQERDRKSEEGVNKYFIEQTIRLQGWRLATEVSGEEWKGGQERRSPGKCRNCKIWLKYGCYFSCSSWCVPAGAAVAKLSDFWPRRDAPMVSDPAHTPRRAHHAHMYTHTYTKNLPLPSSYSRRAEWIKGKIIHRCEGLQTGRPLFSRLPPSCNPQDPSDDHKSHSLYHRHTVFYLWNTP